MNTSTPEGKQLPCPGGAALLSAAGTLPQVAKNFQENALDPSFQLLVEAGAEICVALSLGLGRWSGRDGPRLGPNGHQRLAEPLRRLGGRIARLIGSLLL